MEETKIELTDGTLTLRPGFGAKQDILWLLAAQGDEIVVLSADVDKATKVHDALTEWIEARKGIEPPPVRPA